MGKSTNPRFRPVGKKRNLVLDNKPKTKTSLYYQRGFVNDKIALRIYKNKKSIKTLVSNDKTKWPSDEKNIDIWEIIRDLGGQSPDRAHFQREEALTKIVRNYFEKYGYNVKEQPTLCDNTPDLLVTKKKFCLYVEIKAYFGKTYVGEPEISQILKYYAIYRDDKELMELVESGKIFPPKFALITTGNLVSLENNSLLNGDIDTIDGKDAKIKHIDKKYKKYVKDLGYARSLEARDTRSIYRWGFKKIEKYYIPDNWGSPKIYQFEKPESLIDLMETKNDYDIFLIPSDIFRQILIESNLNKEAEYFKRISESWMERLVFNRNLIEF